MNDQTIIDLFYKRSEEALIATSDKYGILCKTISNRILRNEEDTEECVNDTYLILWNTIPPQNPNPLVAYICKIVRNISLKKYRFNTAQKRNSYYDASIDDIAEYISDGKDIEDGIMEQQLTEKLNEFLSSVKEIDRVIFIKKYWFCMEINEIAKEMELSTNYVNVHLHRIKGRLKQFLEKENCYEERIG